MTNSGFNMQVKKLPKERKYFLDEYLRGENQKQQEEFTAKDAQMELGDLDLDEIVGQDEAISELKRFAESILYRSIYMLWNTKVPKGILLVGPPGTGKTAAVRALGRRLIDRVTLMSLSYIDIANKWVDAPIESLRMFFKAAEAESKKRHVIIFIDEIDAMIPNRENQIHETSAKRVNVFLEWMSGGYNNIENITVIGATNYLEGIDTAAIRAGRFDKIIYFKDLTTEAKVDGLKLYIKKRNLTKLQLGDINWNMVSKALERKSICGADLPEIVNTIVSKKISEHIKILQDIKFDEASIEEKKQILKNPIYYPEPISTEDLVTTIKEYRQGILKDNSGLNSIGFDLSTAL